MDTSHHDLSVWPLDSDEIWKQAIKTRFLSTLLIADAEWVRIKPQQYCRRIDGSKVNLTRQYKHSLLWVQVCFYKNKKKLEHDIECVQTQRLKIWPSWLTNNSQQLTEDGRTRRRVYSPKWNDCPFSATRKFDCARRRLCGREITPPGSKQNDHDHSVCFSSLRRTRVVEIHCDACFLWVARENSVLLTNAHELW